MQQTNIHIIATIYAYICTFVSNKFILREDLIRNRCETSLLSRYSSSVKMFQRKLYFICCCVYEHEMFFSLVPHLFSHSNRINGIFIFCCFSRSNDVMLCNRLLVFSDKVTFDFYAILNSKSSDK